MSAKKQSVVYRLPKQGYDEIDPEEWSDMAICDAYDDAVGGEKINSTKEYHHIKPKYTQFMQNSTQNTKKDGLAGGDNPSPHSKPKESQNVRKRNHKDENPVKMEKPAYKPGYSYVALYGEDGLYYPCTVVSVDTVKKSCLVQYSGYGNKEHVTFSDIYTEEEFEARPNEQFRSECNEDAASACATVSSATSSLSTCASSSTEGTTSDVTQDIYSDSRGRRKRFDSKRGRHCKHRAEPPFNVPFPNFSPGPFFGMPPPPVLRKSSSDFSDDTLSSMLMSWYMAGYHTGYYQGLHSTGGRKSKKS